MFVQRGADGAIRLVTSATDLTAASVCEFAFLRRVDAKLGRAAQVPPDDDPMLARAARLGDQHEERTLDAYRRELGTGATGVVEIPRPENMGEEELLAVAATTIEALEARAALVFQATFFDPVQRSAELGADEPAIGFVGFADFLRLGSAGTYEVQDTKLARRAKTTALMQLAAYAEQLQRLGIPVAPEATLILGDGARSTHRLSDIAPVFRARRARMHRILLDRYAAVGDDGARESAAPVAWGAPGTAACGRCEVCLPEVERARDPCSSRVSRRRSAIAWSPPDSIGSRRSRSSMARQARRPGSPRGRRRRRVRTGPRTRPARARATRRAGQGAARRACG
ncbi:hypothetical protein AB3K78_09380 [Leucobacter sp. HNU]|uniref:hypothetical protein n=1 Tax=Leucobacter sp. HNU TaxID=3236805 RepID=UPI003A810537